MQNIAINFTSDFIDIFVAIVFIFLVDTISITHNFITQFLNHQQQFLHSH